MIKFKLLFSLTKWSGGLKRNARLALGCVSIQNDVFGVDTKNKAAGCDVMQTKYAHLKCIFK